MYYEVYADYIEIYRDYNHTDKIAHILLTEQLKSGEEIIDIESYLDQVATITYTFKKNPASGKYYFVNIVIK